MHISVAVLSTAACATIAAAQPGRYIRRNVPDEVAFSENDLQARDASPFGDLATEQIYARDLHRRLAHAEAGLESGDLLFLEHLLRRDAKDEIDDSCDDCDDDDTSKKAAAKPKSELEKNKQKDLKNKKKDQENRDKAKQSHSGEEKAKKDKEEKDKTRKKSQQKALQKAKKKAKAKAKLDKEGENDNELLKADEDEDVWDPQDTGKKTKGDKKAKEKAIDKKKKKKQEKKQRKKEKKEKKKKLLAEILKSKTDTTKKVGAHQKEDKDKTKTKTKAAASSSDTSEPSVAFFDKDGKMVADVGGASFKSFTNNALHIDRQAARDGPAMKDGAHSVSTKHLKDSKAVLKLWDNDKADGSPVMEVKGKDLNKEKLPKHVKAFTLTRGG